MKVEIKEVNKQLIASAFFKQLDLVWGMVKYLSTIEVGTLIGWYYLHEKNSHLASSLLLVSVILLFFVIILIQRHSILLERYRIKLGDVLNKPNNFPGTNEPFIEPDINLLNSKVRGHVITRLIAFIMIIINFLLFILEFKIHFFNSCGISILTIYYILILIILLFFIFIIIIFYKKLLIEPKYKL